MILSIVIPTYNRANEVKRAILSIINLLQLHESDCELIVTDNASSDDTVTVVKRLVRNLKNTTILESDENSGPSRNWLRGVEKAEGRYILLLFSDDLMLFEDDEKIFLNNLKVMDSKSIGLIRLPVEICDENLKPTCDKNLIYYPNLNGQHFRTESSNLLYQNLLYPRFLRRFITAPTFCPVSPTGYIIKREKMLDTLTKYAGHKRFEKSGAGVDLMTILNSASQNKEIGIIGSPISKMVSSSTSITKLANSNKITELELRLTYCIGSILSLKGQPRKAFIICLVLFRFISLLLKLYTPRRFGK